MKTIKVSDSLFQRLQALAEPFVDTPAIVIERLMDEHDRKHRSRKMDSSRPRASLPAKARRGGLYLAPAAAENLRKSIGREVPLSFAKEYVREAAYDQLVASLPNRSGFHCWAMTENSRAYWATMKPGDTVLFTTTGTGMFEYQAEVLTKFEDAAFGRRLWSFTRGLPWSLIYILTRVRRVSMPKRKLLRELGYDSGYVVPGITRVSEERLERMLHKTETVQSFLERIAH